MSKRKLCLSPDRTSAKKQKYGSTFQHSWPSMFSWIKKSAQGDRFALCSACNFHINISHGGKNDLTKHSETKAHKANMNKSASTPKLTQMFAAASSAPDRVTKAEVIFSYFVAEHNLPMLVADHFSELVKVMFPDSQIAKDFGCRRTKTTHIINRAIAPAFDETITNMCKTEKFSIMVDESNDHRDQKAMTVLVRVLDRDVQKISTRFLDIPICNIGTGANLFSCLNEVLV